MLVNAFTHALVIPEVAQFHAIDSGLNAGPGI